MHWPVGWTLRRVAVGASGKFTAFPLCSFGLLVLTTCGRKTVIMPPGLICLVALKNLDPLFSQGAFALHLLFPKITLSPAFLPRGYAFPGKSMTGKREDLESILGYITS